MGLIDIETYKENIRKIENFDPEYDLNVSHDEFFKKWNETKEEFAIKIVELINIILEKKIKLIEDTLVLNKMIEDFFKIYNDYEFNKEKISKIIYPTITNKQIISNLEITDKERE